ncbi:MAG: hypothetical protein IKS21_00260 [Oscillospiraceae bacterium]|nr:hypothetical protein [Oscillospiraceae bacterium]
MKGKNKCKILKEIRQKIADENDIPYVTRECTYQGDCKGTCPKCEAELRYLEQELEKRRSLGKTVAVAAVAAGLSLSLSACKPGSTGGNVGANGAGQGLNPDSTVENVLDGEIAAFTDLTDPTETGLELDGVPVSPTDEPLLGELAQVTEPLEGELALPTETETEGPELLGDVVMLPDEIVNATQTDGTAETPVLPANP